MEYVERYLSELRYLLPAENREDVVKETRSILEDMIQDKAEQENRQPDEQLVLEVLQAFGSPGRIAESYRPQQYLIGPELYPTYIQVLKIVALVFIVLALIGNMIPILTDTYIPATLNEVIRESRDVTVDVISAIFRGFFEGAFSAIAQVTILFGILERILPNLRKKSREDEKAVWDPRKLSPVKDKDRISLSDIAIDLIIISVLLLLINVTPKALVFLSLKGSEITVIGKASQTWYNWVPWLNGYLVLSFLLTIYMLIKQRYTALIRVLNIILNAIAMIVTGLMISGPSLLSKEEEVFSSGLINGAHVDLGIAVLGVMLIIFFAIDTVKHFIKLVKTS